MFLRFLSTEFSSTALLRSHMNMLLGIVHVFLLSLPWVKRVDNNQTMKYISEHFPSYKSSSRLSTLFVVSCEEVLSCHAESSPGVSKTWVLSVLSSKDYTERQMEKIGLCDGQSSTPLIACSNKLNVNHIRSSHAWSEGHSVPWNLKKSSTPTTTDISVSESEFCTLVVSLFLTPRIFLSFWLKKWHVKTVEEDTEQFTERNQNARD